MKSVILQEFVSIDGLAAGTDGSVNFVASATGHDRSFGKHQLEFIDSIDTILLGRVTYELFVQYWPNVTSGDDKPFADRLNSLPKVVFSNTLEDAPWGGFEPATVVNTSAVAEVEHLKQGTGRDMVIWGSLSLAKALMKQGLIDEIQLIMCPVVLGEGRKLFDNGDVTGEMHLLTTRAFDRGTVLLSYAGAMIPAAR